MRNGLRIRNKPQPKELHSSNRHRPPFHDLCRKDYFYTVGKPSRETSVSRALSNSMNRTSTMMNTMKTFGRDPTTTANSGAPVSRSVESRRLVIEGKDLSIRFGFRAAHRTMDDSNRRERKERLEEATVTSRDMMTQNRMTVKNHMREHGKGGRVNSGKDTHRSKSANDGKIKERRNNEADVREDKILGLKPVNSEITISDLAKDEEVDQTNMGITGLKTEDGTKNQNTLKKVDYRMSMISSRKTSDLNRLLKAKTRHYSVLKSFDTTGKDLNPRKSRVADSQVQKRFTQKFSINLGQSKVHEEPGKHKKNEIFLNFLGQPLKETSESVDNRISETSFYEDYPIPLPSKMLKEEKWDFGKKPQVFLNEYKERFDHFVYEFFVRDDGMLRSIQESNTYVYQGQKVIREDLREKIRNQMFENTGVLYDSRVGGCDFDYKEFLRFQRIPRKNKYVEFANQEYQRIVPYIEKANEAIDQYGANLKYIVDLRTNMPRFKSNLLPSELAIIDKFYNDVGCLGSKKQEELELLDDILQDLGFFRKIDKDARFRLFQGAVLRKYEPMDFVVQQGEYGNSMFIILYGSANVMINGIHPKTKLPHRFIVASLLDGSSFGEYSLLSFPTPQNTASTINQEINNLKSTLNSKGLKKILEVQKEEKRIRAELDPLDLERHGRFKMRVNFEERQASNFKKVVDELKPKFIPNTRAASIQVVESSYMLEVSADLFKAAIVDKIREEMIEKIRLLSLQSYFANHANINYVPIAMLMKKVDFKHGQTLIKKGEVPTSLLILRSGTCEVVSIMSRSREINGNILKHSIQRPLVNFSFGNGRNKVDIRQKYKESEEERKKEEMLEEDRKVTMPSTRLYVFDPVVGEKTKSGFRKYYDFFMVKRLSSGDSLFTRALHSKNITGDGNVMKEVDQGIEKAKLSVIAASARVECYELRMNQIVFIPQPAKSIMLEELKKFTDHDIEISHNGLKEIEAWDEYKEHEYISQLLSKQITRRNDLFKKF